MATPHAPVGAGWRRRTGYLLTAVLATVAAGIAQPPRAHAVDAARHSRSAAQNGQWTRTTPATVGDDSAFKGVDALGPADVWAVGGTNLLTSNTGQSTLIEHWNGTRWSTVPSPNASGIPFKTVANGNSLNAVAAISADDVWAVGHTTINAFSQGAASLVEHWNGRAWSIVPTPDGVLPTFNYQNDLLGVSGTSAGDVWAVGWNGSIEGDLHRPTIQHWNGSQWTLTSVPSVGADASNVVVAAVSALAPDDVWATGTYSGSQNDPVTHPLALHWNGTAWSVVNPVDLPSGGGFQHVALSAVDAVSAHDVWAVGNVLSTDAQGNGQSQALVEHWNGTAWSTVAGPSGVPAGTATNLDGITALAADDIWAVGTSGLTAHQPLLAHWDGTAWSAVAPPTGEAGYGCGLFAAAAAAGGAAAVGACVASDPGTHPQAEPFAEALG